MVQVLSMQYTERLEVAPCKFSARAPLLWSSGAKVGAPAKTRAPAPAVLGPFQNFKAWRLQFKGLGLRMKSKTGTCHKPQQQTDMRPLPSQIYQFSARISVACIRPSFLEPYRPAAASRRAAGDFNVRPSMRLHGLCCPRLGLGL